MECQEAASTIRSRKSRSKAKLEDKKEEKALLCNTGATNCNTDIDIDIDKYKDLDKELEKEKKETTFDIMIKEFTENEELKTTIYDFIKMRKAITKVMTDRALKTMLNKLNKFTMNEEKQILILEQSIVNSWSDIYELKLENIKQPQQKSIPAWNV